MAKAAKNVSWNLLASAPKNFGSVEEHVMKGDEIVSTKTRSVHAKTGVEFKAGFQMYESDTGDQKWEGQAKAGGFRLDLQGINDGWANWAVQPDESKSKTVASCFMQVGCCFGQRQLVHGLIQSAERTERCYITP